MARSHVEELLRTASGTRATAAGLREVKEANVHTGVARIHAQVWVDLYFPVEGLWAEDFEQLCERRSGPNLRGMGRLN